jgi:putative spermidine/putrescine transport system ATP-binding protein
MGIIMDNNKDLKRIRELVDLLNRGENKVFNIGSEVELMFMKKEIKVY